MRKLFFPFLLIPFFGTAQLNKKTGQIDSVLKYLYQHHFFNGSVLIGEKGKVLYKKAFGQTSADGAQQLTTASSFNLASVSKQFFAMMIMILKEEGKLNY
ncbi:MAG: serine hydrolase, partial [Bacteroidetes bacterium]|nr:serine hydrolase [Bacteroidota bacterium]